MPQFGLILLKFHHGKRWSCGRPPRHCPDMIFWIWIALTSCPIVRVRTTTSVHKCSTGELWRPSSAPSVPSILTHWSQSTVWRFGSDRWASWKMQKCSTGELWRPRSAPLVPSILTHWIQSTIWQLASEPWASWKMQKRSTGELWNSQNGIARKCLRLALFR